MAIFDYNPSAITPFPYWRWNKVLPAVYDDSVSQYEMLCRLLSVVNNIIESTNSTGEQVEALTQLVQQLIDGGFPSGLVDYIKDIVEATMADDVTAINATISALQKQVDSFDESIQAQVNALDDTVTNACFRNDGIILLGDSYAQGVHSASASTNGNNWQDLLISKLGLTNVYKYKGGSAGFIARSTNTSGSASTVPTNTTYQDILHYAYEYINSLGKVDEIKHIIIQGGVNDASQSDVSGVTAAALACINAMHSQFPNAKVHVVYASCGSTSWQSNNNRLILVPGSYKNACRAGGASYNQFTNAPWVYGSDASYDGSHPTNAVQEILAGFIGQVLISGHAEDVSTGVVNENGLYYSITSDHYLYYPSCRLNTNMLTKTWVTNGVDVYSASENRRFFPANFDVPVCNYGAIMGFRFYIDGRIRWILNGGASSLADSIIFPDVRIPIGAV